MMQFKTELKVIVNKRPDSYAREVWLIKLEMEKTYSGSIKKGYIEWKEIKEGERIEDPFLVAPEPVWQQIVDAMVDSTPPIKKEVVDAELKATQFHLGDLRKLLKIK